MPLGAARIPVLLGAIAVVGLAVVLPIASILRWLGYGGVALWQETWIIPAVLQSVAYGVCGAVAATLAALPLAYLAVRYPGRLMRVLEGANYLASSLPGIVVALALVTTLISFGRPLYQTAAVVIVAYVLLFLPRSLVSLRGGLAQVPVSLEEASRSLGVSPSRTFLRVTARLLAPAAFAGGALVFLGIVNELTATLLLAPTGTRTLATQFSTHVKDLHYAQAAPYALLMIALSMPVTWLLFRSSRLDGDR
jgi:iron(III) transport system permease protein